MRRRAVWGLERAPCVRIEHLNDNEQRVLRLAINRLGETGDWNLETLKIEFEELILADAPIEISGFTLDEIDQITLGDRAQALEEGPLEPQPLATPVSRLGDVFQLGLHRIACADATYHESLDRVMGKGEVARLVLTDEPYNVPIAGNVTKGRHREFAMASGEMSEGEFLTFNEAWMRAVLPHLCSGPSSTGEVPNGERRGCEAWPHASEPHCVGEDERGHGQPLPLSA